MREMAIFKKLIRILTRKRKVPKEKRVRIEEKLRKKERLTNAEFWQVYEPIRQDGPIAKYSNPTSGVSKNSFHFGTNW
jgi:hypothetical protein